MDSILQLFRCPPFPPTFNIGMKQSCTFFIFIFDGPGPGGAPILNVGGVGGYTARTVARLRPSTVCRESENETKNKQGPPPLQCTTYLCVAVYFEACGACWGGLVFTLIRFPTEAAEVGAGVLDWPVMPLTGLGLSWEQLAKRFELRAARANTLNSKLYKKSVGSQASCKWRVKSPHSRLHTQPFCFHALRHRATSPARVIYFLQCR